MFILNTFNILSQKKNITQKCIMYKHINNNVEVGKNKKNIFIPLIPIIQIKEIITENHYKNN